VHARSFSPLNQDGRRLEALHRGLIGGHTQPYQDDHLLIIQSAAKSLAQRAPALSGGS
jgi:hypothetical protein